jgi:hypothetical protein
MSDVESFFGADDRGEAMDPAAFERFKERMAAAAAQLKALQKQEQKQKKKEDELVKILLRFIQTGTKRDIMLLVSRCLEQNIPAAFIVSILLINNADIQNELGVKLLPAGAIEEEKARALTLPDHYLKGELIPLKIKIAIDAWAHEIIERSQEYAHRIVDSVFDPDGLIKLVVLQLGVFCLRDYLQEEGIALEYDLLKQFVQLMLEGILKKMEEELKNRKLIR